MANVMNLIKYGPLGQLHIGSGIEFGPLTVFPVWTDAPAGRRFAIATGDELNVRELDEPRVDSVEVWHDLDTELLLLEGTLLVGGRQTRVATRDHLIARGERIWADVRCVEQGRWGGGHQHGVDGRAPVSVRAAMRRGADQGEVWRRVNRLEATYGARPTSSLHHLMSESLPMGRRLVSDGTAHMRMNTSDFAEMRSDIRGVDEWVLQQLRDFCARPLPGMRGFIIGIAGSPVSLELFGSVAACREQLLPNLTAALIDAGSLPVQRRTTASAARSFVRGLDALTNESWSPGFADEADYEWLDSSTPFADASIVRRLDTKAVLHASLINMQHELALAL